VGLQYYRQAELGRDGRRRYRAFDHLFARHWDAKVPSQRAGRQLAAGYLESSIAQQIDPGGTFEFTAVPLQRKDRRVIARDDQIVPF
jgi:hypothetical protein